MVSFRTAFVALMSAPLLAFAQNATSSEPNAPLVPGGFSGTAGSPLNLQWTPTTSGTVTLVLRTGNSANLDQGSIIASSIDNSGSYTWDVPSDLVRGSDYTIEIVSTDDTSVTNYWPYFVIDSTVTVATTTASTVSLGAPASSVDLNSVLPTPTPVVTASSLNSVLSTASLSASNYVILSGSMTTSTSSSSSSGSSASSASSTSSNAAGFQGSTSTTPATNAAPRATAMAGLLGVVALGALAL